MFTLQAEGEAQVTELRARAQAKAIELIAVSLDKAGGTDAAKLHVAREVHITL